MFARKRATWRIDQTFSEDHEYPARGGPRSQTEYSHCGKVFQRSVSEKSRAEHALRCRGRCPRCYTLHLECNQSLEDGTCESCKHANDLGNCFG